MLRRILLASAGAMALTGAARAADLAPPPVFLPLPPIFTWTGFYAGLNAGYTFGGSNSVDVATAPGVSTGGEQIFANADAVSATDVLSLHNSGFIGGGQIGYNLQFANSWLAGIETDIQGTGARSSASDSVIAPVAGVRFGIAHAQSNISVNDAVDYLGTVRGRLGFLATPTLLIYGDGGFAYGGVHEGVDIAVTLPPVGTGTSPAFGSFTNTRAGWTAGGGLEWMFSPNWSLKAEYLYYDLGRATFGVGGLTHFSSGPALFTDLPVASTRFDGHIVRVGLNYHFNWWGPGPAGAIALTGGVLAAGLPGGGPPPVFFLPPSPIFTWTGFYAGLNAGYTFGGSNSVDVETASGVANLLVNQPIANAVAASATDVLSLHNSGFIGGGQVGYNLQFASSWLAGIEADIQGTGARSSASDTVIVPIAFVPPSVAQAQGNISVKNAVDYLGTVRGRLGFLATPTLLIYGDGGFAYGGVHEGVDVVSTLPPSGFGATPAFASFTNTRAGWTAGGGLEWMVSPNWSVKAEYLYYDLGRVTFGIGGLTQTVGGVTFFTDPATASTRFNGHIVRVGLNYHFDWWGPGPVVAKY